MRSMAGTPFPDRPTVYADITDAAAMERAFAGQDAAAFHLPFECDRARAAHLGTQIAEGARRAGLPGWLARKRFGHLTAFSESPDAFTRLENAWAVLPRFPSRRMLSPGSKTL